MPEASEPIVVNTGPMIALGACGQIGLLQLLHPRVVVPATVVVELEREYVDEASMSVGVLRPEWIEIQTAANPPSPLLLAYLDEGEAAVISLALELGFPRVLIDERRGRLVARTMGLRVSGSVGVLLRAKKEGMLSAVRPCLESMHSRGIWLSERLIAFALREAGEV